MMQLLLYVPQQCAAGRSSGCALAYSAMNHQHTRPIFHIHFYYTAQP
jgi:hypothetical protein